MQFSSWRLCSSFLVFWETFVCGTLPMDSNGSLPRTEPRAGPGLVLRRFPRCGRGRGHGAAEGGGHWKPILQDGCCLPSRRPRCWPSSRSRTEVLCRVQGADGSSRCATMGLGRSPSRGQWLACLPGPPLCLARVSVGGGGRCTPLGGWLRTVSKNNCEGELAP